jgi:hypothetical protein
LKGFSVQCYQWCKSRVELKAQRMEVESDSERSQSEEENRSEDEKIQSGESEGEQPDEGEEEGGAGIDGMADMMSKILHQQVGKKVRRSYESPFLIFN